MTHLRLIHGGDRPNLAELEPELRERILAFDEPVAHDDWAEVVSRSHAYRPVRPRSVAVALVAAVLVVAAGGSTVAMQLGASGSPSGQAVQPAASEFDFGSPSGAGGVASRKAVTISVQLSAGSHALYVSKTPGGGFCYEWASEAHGCQVKPVPISVAWGSDRVVGTVSATQVSSVEIRFTDGSVVMPSISWVAKPISTGFFSYAIPSGKTVAAVIANDHGFTRGRVPWYAV